MITKLQHALFLSLGLIAANTAAFAASAPIITDTASTSIWNRFYALGQLGWGRANISSDNFSIPFETSETSNHDNDGLAGRAALGYTILPSYLDVQMGYTQYHDATADHHISDEFIDFSDKMRNQLYTVDLTLVGKLPINQFYLYGKAGEAYTHIHTKFDSEIGNEALDGDHSDHAYRPLVGVGAGYNITQHVFTEAGYQYLFGKGELGDSEYIPDLQFASLGVGVRF